MDILPALRGAVLPFALLLSGCAGRSLDVDGGPAAAADTFLGALRSLCGQSFAGRVVVDAPPPTGPDPFAGQALVMHIRECSDREVRIPFHVGEDRSRTWIVTRTQAGLRLKHRHRHADGSDDAVTMYGGDTVDEGSAARQAFPVDEESKAMFVREGRAVSVTNTWAMDIDPGQTFTYELSRPGGRLFRVEFDLRHAVATPPAPWGNER